MKMNSKKYRIGMKQQRGMTLVELLIAGVISLIASGGMLILMANTLGSGSQTIQMARLTQEMRTAMQIMTRELRRANYHSTFMACYGNVDCRTNLSIADKVTTINITDNGDSDCFWFWYDRPQSGTAVAVTSEPVAAFRLTTITGGIGKLQMTTTQTSTPNCNLDTGWVDITDTDIIDIQTFNVSDVDSIAETINTAGYIQNVERIGLTITAKLVNDPLTLSGLTAPTNPERELREFIKVRNHTVAAP